MEALPRKSESRKGKKHRTPKTKKNRSSLNPDGIAHTFVNVNVIEYGDTTDEDSCSTGRSEMKILENTLNSKPGNDGTNDLTPTGQCEDRQSGGYNIDADMTSCKPCSVILERLSEEAMRNLLPRDELEEKKIKKDNRRKRLYGDRKRRHTAGAIDRRNSDVKVDKGDRRPKEHSRRRSSNSITRENRSEVESSNLDKTTRAIDGRNSDVEEDKEDRSPKEHFRKRSSNSTTREKRTKVKSSNLDKTTRAIDGRNSDVQEDKEDRSPKEHFRKRSSNSTTREKRRKVKSSNLDKTTRAIDGRNSDVQEDKEDRSPKEDFKKRSSNSITREKRREVKSSNRNKTIESNGESLASSSHDKNQRSSPVLHVEKIGSDNSSENQARRQDSHSKTPRIEDSCKNKGSEISPMDSECRILRRKWPTPKLKNDFADKKNDEVSEQDSHTKILHTEDSKEIEDTGMNSEDSERTVLLLNQLRLVFEPKSTGSNDDASPRKDSSSKTLQAEDCSATENGGLSSNDSENKVLPVKKFNLSLRRKKSTNTKDDEARGLKASSKISQLEDSDKILGSSVSNSNPRRRSKKRKLIDNNEVEAPVRKRKKAQGKHAARSNDCDKVDELDSTERESGVPRHRDQEDTPGEPQVLRNSSNKQKVSHKVRNKFSTVKDLRVSLMELRDMENPSTSKLVDAGSSDSCMDIVGGGVDDCEINISEIKPQNLDVVQSWSNRTRDTKITDYFFKIDKNSSVSKKNQSTKVKQRKEDLMLRQKHGILKDAVVLLFDITKLEYADSFRNINSTGATADMLSSSSVSSSNNLPCSSNESSKNNQKSPTDVTNPPPVHDDALEVSHDSSHNHTVPLAKNLSPKGHESPRFRSHSAAKNTPDSLTDTTFENSVSLRSRKEKELANIREHREDYSDINKDLDADQEVSSSQNSSELRVIPQSPLTNVNKLENRSPESQIVNTMAKSLRVLNSRVRTSTRSPRKHIVLINDEIVSNEPQVCQIDTSNELSKSNEVEEKRDDNTVADIPEALPDDNEVREEPNATPVMSTDSNSVVDRLNTHPILKSVVKSPTKVRSSVIHVKREGPKMQLPVNSMTILSRDMIEGQNSWIDLDINIDNVAEDNTTTENHPALGENESVDIIPSDNMTKKKTETSCDTTQSVDNNSLENSNPVGAIENPEDGKLSEDRVPTESQDENSLLPKSLNSENTERLSVERPACPNVETCPNEENALTRSNTVQEKVDDVQGSDLIPEIEKSALDIQSSKPITSVGVPIDPISVECQDPENASCEDELSMDSQQECQLVIDTDESDSEPQLTEGIPLGVSSSNCSNISTNEAVLDEKTSKQSETSSRKECIICKKTFPNVKGLEFHLRVHVRSTDGCCLLCDKPLTKKTAIKHYLEHCDCFDDGPTGLYPCGICGKNYSKKTSLLNHVKSKHSSRKTRRRSKMSSGSEKTTVDHNQCAVCQLTCNTEEELFAHVYTHTSQELQDAFKAAMDERNQKLGPTSTSENLPEETPEKLQVQEKEQIPSESTKAATDTSPSPCLAVPTFEASVCICHKDERLEIVGGVIIEMGLACAQCKTFFKSCKCFKDHYNTTSCKGSDRNLVAPKMFCNECCMILNNVQDMHEHLTKHGQSDTEIKVSLFCKHCNIFFFSIGPLFYTHWSRHWKDPLFLADHNSFLNKTKVKIVEPGSPESPDEDEPTECLFLADYQCHKCEKPFQIEADLEKHCNSSNTCSEKVASEPQVIENSKLAFNLICSICLKEFSDKSTFDTHIEEHDTIKDFLHVTKCLDKSSEDNPLTCSICKTEYDTITAYEEHLKRHEVIQEKFLCNYCNLMMDSVEDFQRHATEHKGTPEKPIVCNVVFATAKFHCKPCKIWFANQSILDEHLIKTHTNLHSLSPRSEENSINKIVPTIKKKTYVCETCQKEFDDQLKLDAHISTHKEDAPDHSKVDQTVIHLSDDSNSTDVEIIATETNKESAEPVPGNTLLQDQQETAITKEIRKPAFLRVKNLKELLPYACSKCKAEFDTQINLNKHVCSPHVIPVQKTEFRYSCRICKNYKCSNNSEWNIHVLSHYPLQSSQKFQESWFHVLKMSSGQQIFKCNVCSNYESLTVHAMRQHFIIKHPDMYHPIFKCRICCNFKTEVENEIRRHEAAHFQRPSQPRSLLDSGHNSSSTEQVKNSHNWQQPISIPPATSSGNNASPLEPLENFCNSQQMASIPTPNNLSDNVSSSSSPLQPVDRPNNLQQSDNSPALRPLQNFTNSQQVGPTVQSDNNSNNFQQSIAIPPTTSSGNNLPSMQNCGDSQRPVSTAQQDNNSSNDPQQSITVPRVTNSNSKLPPVQPIDNSNNFQQSDWIPPVISSGNNLPWFVPLQTLNNSQRTNSTLQPGSNTNDFQPSISTLSVPNSSSNLPPNQQAEDSNNFQQSTSIPSIAISSGNLPQNQQVDNSNNFQQPVLIPPVSSSGNNLPSIQPLQNFNNSQQSSPIVQPDNNSNNFQQSIPIPSVTSSGNNLTPLQQMENTQWLATSAPTFQIQISNAPPFNNMTNMMHTLPLYVTNLIYCCRICKTFKCSSEQELKVHEALHEFMQLSDTSKKLYRCKVCTNIFCPSEEQLKAHMEVYHNSEKSNPPQNQKQSDVMDTEFKCKHCPQTFATSVHLSQHIYTNHTFPLHQQNDNQFQHSYPYNCQICTIGFLNEAFLHAHMRLIHPNVKFPRQKPSEAKTLYQCNICGLLLISEATLNYHMRSHNIGFR